MPTLVKADAGGYQSVEDTFVVTGDALRHARTQLQIESELLDAAGGTRPVAAA